MAGKKKTTKGKKAENIDVGDYGVLRLTAPMMHGPAVKRFQEMTDLIGIDLGPNDGIYGPNTEAECLAFQRHSGLKADGVCGPLTWDKLIEVVEEKTESTIESPTVVINRVGQHPRPKWYKCQRMWQAIEGVTLHQTGCRMPRTPGGWDRLNAHFGIPQAGGVLMVNDPRDWIWHAQGLSRFTIGIEIEGNGCGLDGDLTTLWKGGGGPHVLSEGQVTALETCFGLIETMFKRAGQKWRCVHGHRQSKSTRVADPGEEIWKMIAVPWQNLLGIRGRGDGGPEYCRGDGRPIPIDWDPMNIHKYR